MTKRVFATVAILGCMAFVWSPCAHAANVAVIMSDSLTSTTRTLQGARKVIERGNPGVALHTFTIGQNPNDRALLDSILSLKPAAILTIGSSATALAKQNFPRTPIVFAGVMYPVLSGFVQSNQRPGGTITGASLDIPNEVQFRYFKKIIPDIRTIGVLYTANTASLIPSARAVARGMGIDLVAIEIKDSKELPVALDSLASVVQGIWSVADPVLFDPQATRYILLNTLRKSIPFMGFSRYVVESGALFALDFDYKAVGIQAGQILNRVLSGENPGEINVSAADVIWFHYNEKTAQHIRVTIPDELVAVAKEVYR